MQKMKSKASQQNRFLRIITVPVRALSRARDFYVRSITDYADKMNYGNAMAIPVTSQVTSLPKSFSVSSARTRPDQDLVRASSTRSMGDRAELESYIKQQMRMTAGPRPGPHAMSLGAAALRWGGSMRRGRAAILVKKLKLSIQEAEAMLFLQEDYQPFEF